MALPNGDGKKKKKVSNITRTGGALSISGELANLRDRVMGRIN